MAHNLLKDAWTNLDSFELSLLLDERIGNPSQYDGQSSKRLYLPLADSSCRVMLVFRDKKIIAVEPGSAFDVSEWEQISEEIEKSILVGPLKVGRNYSFSSFRVGGWWQGENSRVRILPPPEDAPRAPVEMADHPFILEFPVKGCAFWPITRHRLLREHRNLTLLLNVLLVGRTSFQSRRSTHFWACIRFDADASEIRWVQEFFYAKLGEVIVDESLPVFVDRLEEVEPEEYYMKVGHDGKGLRVPSDLDQSICLYTMLSPANKRKFNRSIFWMDMASRQWNISVSASFASLVSAIESLTDRSSTHRFKCPICGKPTQHETSGATQRFKDFFETYAPGAALLKERDDMYSLRSGILHGSELMQIDQDLAFGWDPLSWNERELHNELWSLTRIALRNWLKNPPAN